MNICGEFYHMENGTILRIIEERNGGICKVRCIRPCKGRHAAEERIGAPYSYQGNMRIDLIKKRGKRIGTEEILMLLFDAKRG